jgi:hypothetical protein
VFLAAPLIASSLPPRYLKARRQTPGSERFAMFDNYIIEIRSPKAGRTVQAGIVVRDGTRFRFFAAADAFNALEAQCFTTPKAAEDAARRRFVQHRSRDSTTGDRATSGQVAAEVC